jgi:hypothetical protein
VKGIVEKYVQRLMPENHPLSAKLVEVTEEKPFDVIDKSTGEVRVVQRARWRFEITGGEFTGWKASGRTDVTINNNPRNKFFAWSKALLHDTQLDEGDPIDTDYMIGRECYIVLKNRPDREDPSRIWQDVEDVSEMTDWTAPPVVPSAEAPF